MSEEVLEARIEVLEEQIERLQEQLKEANEVITMPEDIMYHDELVEKRENYLKKWGVK